jgi:hypothetical protein
MTVERSSSVRGGLIVGKAIGQYLSQMVAAAGVQATSLASTAKLQASTLFALGVHIDYPTGGEDPRFASL